MASQENPSLEYYTFDPLQDEEKIRILKIHSAHPSVGIITCELEHSKNPKDDEHGFSSDESDRFGYEALSWCWGKGSPNKTIRICRGNKTYSFDIHETLHQALLSLRHEVLPRYLWVDAICINQSNPEERSQQVARMNEVYGEARRVCIWLGIETETSRKAMEFVPKILEVFKFEELCNNKKHVDEWIALLDLLKRPWFSRRWVVQEVLLAQDAIVHCGSAHVSWKQLATTISLLNNGDIAMKNVSELVKTEGKGRYRNANDFAEEVAALGASKLVDTSSRLFKKSIGGQSQRVSSLEEIVARLAMFRASDPRDIIYALLALAKDSQPSIEGIPQYLGTQKLSSSQRKALQTVARLLPKPYRESYVVNYEQRIVDVYQQFIVFAIARSDPTRALDVICRPFARSYTYEEDLRFKPELLSQISEGGGGDTVPLPSWIPNASEMEFAVQTEAGESGTWFMTRNRGDLFVSPPDSPPYYSAAGTQKHKIRFRKDRDNKHYSMFVTGFVLDEIKDADPASQLGNLPRAWMKRGHRYAKKDNAMFWKTLVADRGPKGNNAPPLFYENTIEAALKHAREDGGFDTSAHIQSRSTGIVADALRQIQATVFARCLFETSKGHLGLAPDKTVDMMKYSSRLVVCILYGCSVPVVLREVRKSEAELETEREQFRKDWEERFERIKVKLEKLVRPVQLRFKKRSPSDSPSTLPSDCSILGPIKGKRERRNTLSREPAHPDANHRCANAAAFATATSPGFNLDEANGTSIVKRDGDIEAYGETPNAMDGRGSPPVLKSLSNATAVRISILCAVIACIACIASERTTAALLVWLTLPHVAMDLLVERDCRSEGNSEFHPIEILTYVCFFFLLLIGSYLAFGVLIAAPFLILFPDLLPLPLADPFRRGLGDLAHLSLSDIPVLILGAMPRRLIVRSTDTPSAASITSRPQTVDVEQEPPIRTNKLRLLPAREAPESSRAVQEPVTTDSQADNIPSTARAEPEPLPSPEPLPCWYELVGECYVHNMMNGEAIEAQNNSIFELSGNDGKTGRILSQEFELR